MKSVEDLDVFKLAHQLALKTYSTTKTFPSAQTFSLVDQMRRAATSVGMNLMEGAMRPVASCITTMCDCKTCPRLSLSSAISIPRS
jgi:hypothetical protein